MDFVPRLLIGAPWPPWRPPPPPKRSLRSYGPGRPPNPRPPSPPPRPPGPIMPPPSLGLLAAATRTSLKLLRNISIYLHDGHEQPTQLKFIHSLLTPAEENVEQPFASHKRGGKMPGKSQDKELPSDQLPYTYHDWWRQTIKDWIINKNIFISVIEKKGPKRWWGFSGPSLPTLGMHEG